MKTTVVHLITLLELGGAQGNTLHTVNHLNSEKFDVHLWSGPGAYWDRDAQQSIGSKNRLRYFPRLVRPVQPFFDLMVILDLWRALKNLKPAIVHTHSSKAGIVGRLAARLAGVPIVIHTFHGFGFNDHQKPWTKWFFIQLERWMAPLSSTLIFVSESNRAAAQLLKIGTIDQYELIRSGVPISKTIETASKTDEEDLRRKLNIPLNCPIVITIGPFKPQKNLDDFISMAHKILQKNASVHFLLAGDGEQRPEMESRIQHLGISSNVHLLGWRNDTAQLLSISKVFAMTSLWEGLPRSLVEAMVLGIPATCYDTDGVREILIRGGGMLVRQGDLESMAQNILTLIDDKSIWNKTSELAKQSIPIEFDIDFMVTQQEILYENRQHMDNSRRIN